MALGGGGLAAGLIYVAAAEQRRWTQWMPAARVVATLAGLALAVAAAPERDVRRAATGVMAMTLLEHGLVRRV